MIRNNSQARGASVRLRAANKYRFIAAVVVVGSLSAAQRRRHCSGVGDDGSGCGSGIVRGNGAVAAASPNDTNPSPAIAAGIPRSRRRRAQTSESSGGSTTIIISGHGFFDSRGDGIRHVDDVFDIGKADVDVQLLTCDTNEVVRTTVTDDSGYYAFEELDGGQRYYIRVPSDSLPTWHVFGDVWNGATEEVTGVLLHPNADSAIDPESGRTDCYGLEEGVGEVVIDFGLVFGIPSVDTRSPTAAPTPPPSNTVVEPTTIAPSNDAAVVSSAPTSNPTLGPISVSLPATLPPSTKGPSESPSGSPANSPIVTLPTGSPSTAPISGDLLPTAATLPPIEGPSTLVTLPLSPPPSTKGPSESPSKSPATLINAPGNAPVVPPSISPSTSPSTSPTVRPTSSEPTPEPSRRPIASASAAPRPSSSPSASPIRSGESIGPTTTERLLMNIGGIEMLEDEEAWSSATANHIMAYFDALNENGDVGVFDVTVRIRVTDQTSGDDASVERRRRRRLLLRGGWQHREERRRAEEDAKNVVVEYGQTSAYKTSDPEEYDEIYVAAAPFSTQLDLDAYVYALRSLSPYYDDVSSIAYGEMMQPTTDERQRPEEFARMPPSDDDDDDDDPSYDGLKYLFAALVVIFGGSSLAFISIRRNKRQEVILNPTGSNNRGPPPPPSSISSGRIGNDLDGETTNAPADRKTLDTEESREGPPLVVLAEHRMDRMSSVTMGVVGLSPAPSARRMDRGNSSARLDAMTRKMNEFSARRMSVGPENSSNLAGGGGGGDGSNVGLLGGIPETSSNIAEGGGSGASNTRSIHVNVPTITVKIDVIAPAGQLGIVVETRPAGGPTYICTIHADSPIIDQVHLGDKVVAVDDEDVRDMSAVQISELLMSKSEQTERRITVHRRVEEESARDDAGGVADDVRKLQIVAPPGNLGIVVESSPVDGHAYVCEISETSNLFGRLQVGDRIIAVDDEDVRFVLGGGVRLSEVNATLALAKKNEEKSRAITVLRKGAQTSNPGSSREVEGSARNAGGVVDDVQQLQIVAPPGNLGVVVESSPVDGHAYVCEISETSNLFGRLQVGDRIMAVDDEDVKVVPGGGVRLSEVNATLALAKKNEEKSKVITVLRKGTQTSNPRSTDTSSITFDDASFSAASIIQNRTVSSDRRLDIVAPSGKMCITLDTPEQPGPAYVLAVQEDSPLFGKLHLNDKILALDDEDVQRMKATTVSHMLATKSSNPERKITVSREGGIGSNASLLRNPVKDGRRLDIIAPKGKIGITLVDSETAGSVNPVYVSIVQKDSPLVGKIRVGDKVIAVDDVDVRLMSSPDISQLLALKSSNERRQITILRESGRSSDSTGAESYNIGDSIGTQSHNVVVDDASSSLRPSTSTADTPPPILAPSLLPPPQESNNPRSSTTDMVETPIKDGRRLDIIIPKGKIGITLVDSETAGSVDPVYVSIIQKDSPLVGKIRVGDKVIAVDDVDVRKMSSTDIGQVLALKSSNERRQITILREPNRIGDSIGGESHNVELDDASSSLRPSTSTADTPSPIIAPSLLAPPQKSSSPRSSTTTSSTHDDASSSAASMTQNPTGSSDRRLDIIAPSGSLGITLATPEQPGPAYVLAIQMDSPLIGKLHLNDKIIALDGEDVQRMMAIRVTDRLAKRSSNPERKITVTREGGVGGDQA